MKIDLKNKSIKYDYEKIDLEPFKDIKKITIDLNVSYERTNEIIKNFDKLTELEILELHVQFGSKTKALNDFYDLTNKNKLKKIIFHNHVPNIKLPNRIETCVFRNCTIDAYVIKMIPLSTKEMRIKTYQYKENEVKHIEIKYAEILPPKVKIICE